MISQTNSQGVGDVYPPSTKKQFDVGVVVRKPAPATKVCGGFFGARVGPGAGSGDGSKRREWVNPEPVIGSDASRPTDPLHIKDIQIRAQARQRHPSQHMHLVGAKSPKLH